MGQSQVARCGYPASRKSIANPIQKGRGQMQNERPVLVVQREGRTTVVTGWRALVLTLSAIVGAVAAFVFVGFVFLGMALTIGAVLLFVLPLAIVLALASVALGRRN